MSKDLSTRERVYLAADELLADTGSRPTVTAVRAKAGCSNADATLFLREWRAERAEQAAADADVPAMPEAVEQLAARNAAALWKAAVFAARTEHEAALAAARAQVEDARAETDGLASQADDAAHAAHLLTEEVARLTQQVEQLKADAAEQRAGAARINEEALAQARAAQEEAHAAREAAAAAETARAQAEGVSAGLREALTHLTPETK